ncbi:MAG: ABC transporter permease [Candidatus Aminicenantes bacterium]|nr:ABC transporter permease [Candidatus Aminicenantes bacterium]
MRLNSVKPLLRSIFRQKGYTIINLFGLSLGMSCCILLYLFVRYETSYDRFHPHAERTYRIISQDEGDGILDRFVFTPAPLAPALKREFPEVDKTARLNIQDVEFLYKGMRIHRRACFADPEIFDLFSIPLVAGDPATVLNDPRAILISKTVRDSYFKNSDPIGQIFTLYGTRNYTISGIFQDIPANSHIKFDVLGSFADEGRRHHDAWGVSNYFTYIRLSPNTSINSLEEKMPAFIDEYKGEEARRLYKFRFLFQPLTSIHIHSHWRGEMEAGTRMGTLYVFSAAALFILLIACFNAVNLSLARYTNRAPEVGIRKILGAGRFRLVRHYLGESFLLVLIALPAAFLLVEGILPLFRGITGKSFHLLSGDHIQLLFFITGIVIFTGFVSGLYPALFISSLKPLNIIKNRSVTGIGFSFFRRSLVVLQFVISITFIICTVIISKQLRYMHSKEMGFDKEHVVMIPINEKSLLDHCETLKAEFRRDARILSASATSFFPGNPVYRQNFRIEGMSENDYPMINWMAVDHDFIQTLQAKIIAGRDFSPLMADSEGGGYILNESAVKSMGWDPGTAVGKMFNLGAEGRVVGVVKDFNFRSLHQEVDDMVLAIWPDLFRYMAVRISPGDIKGAMAYLKDVWERFTVQQPFSYFFLDDQFDSLYEEEKRLEKIFGYVTVLSILIACLGLLALASYAVERRIKEIGIRKVLGSSEGRLVWLICRDFAGGVALANLMAWPAAYFLMGHWLQNFAYRISPSACSFAFSGAAVLTIALATVGFRALRAAHVDPVQVLRHE